VEVTKRAITERTGSPFLPFPPPAFFPISLHRPHRVVRRLRQTFHHTRSHHHTRCILFVVPGQPHRKNSVVHAGWCINRLVAAPHTTYAPSQHEVRRKGIRTNYSSPFSHTSSAFVHVESA